MTKHPQTNCGSPSRRRFLTSTAAVAASLGAARFVHSQEPAAADKSPNAKMNAAIIGTGGRGGSHIEEMLAADNAQITHICEVDASIADKRAGEIEKKQGMRPKIESDIRRLLEDKSLDVVTIATPNHWHALGGIWAMQAGKDAYIEKPVCHNIAEGTALIAAAKKYGRMCQVGTQCRSSKACQDAVAFIASGGIGEVKFARGLCYKRRKSIGALGDYEIPGNVDFNLWSGPAKYTDPKLTRKQFHYDWHWQRLYGNGDSGNQGPHQTDVARWGLGIDTHPNAIISYGGRLGYQAERQDPNYVDAGDTANTQVTVYDYGDKCIVFETRGLSVDDSADEELNRMFDSKSGNKIGVVFYGTEGYVVQRSYSHCIAFDKDMNVIKEFRIGGNLNDSHFGNFLEACEKRDASILNAGVREGHLSAGLSHLGNISYYLGESNQVSEKELSEILAGVKSLDDNAATLQRTIAHLKQNDVDLEKSPLTCGPYLKFDPEAEIFPGSPEATELVSREYRADFVCPKATEV
ncbi:MAG: Gfo/Idh/MocA family oxidoreductase [Pirellulaceae bacterium]